MRRVTGDLGDDDHPSPWYLSPLRDGGAGDAGGFGDRGHRTAALQSLMQNWITHPHNPILTLNKNGPSSRFLSAIASLSGQPVPVEIGDRIRAARRRAGLTQVRLAAAIGVNKSAVAHWEAPSAERTAISTDNLLAVARVLQIDVSDLVGTPGEAELRLTDPKEIALIATARRLPPRLSQTLLDLAITMLGILGSEETQPERNPAQRRRTRAARANKNTA